MFLRTRRSLSTILCIAAFVSPSLAVCPISGTPNTSPTQQAGATGTCGSTVWNVGYVDPHGAKHMYSQFSPSWDCAGGTYQCNCSYEQPHSRAGYLTGNIVIEGSSVWSIVVIATEQQPIQRVNCSEWDQCCDNANDPEPQPITQTIVDVATSC